MNRLQYLRFKRLELAINFDQLGSENEIITITSAQRCFHFVIKSFILDQLL